MRITILGTRGIPAAYGGFETFAEELGVRLVQRGHEVMVAARHRFGERRPADRVHRGVLIRSYPTIFQKYLETPLHAATSFCGLFGADQYVVLLCNAANSPFAWLVKLAGHPLVINVDGIERRRAKWNALGRLWYRLGERCSVWFADRVVADAEVIAHYYRQRYRTDPAVIAYGAEAVNTPPGELMSRYGLVSKGYLLYVSRLEPENNALGVIEAYVRSGVSMPLVVVGDAPYANEYKLRLRAAANERVHFTGFQFGIGYRELRANCYAYIQATEVGGTHPALVEAMAYGNCVIANDTPEHREVLRDAGLYYDLNDFQDLARQLVAVVGDNQAVSRWGTLAAARALEHFRWDKITDQYEELFRSLVFHPKSSFGWQRKSSDEP